MEEEVGGVVVVLKIFIYAPIKKWLRCAEGWDGLFRFFILRPDSTEGSLA